MASIPQHSDHDLFIDILKYIATGFISITSMFFLWVFGKYKKQHEEMYSAHLDITGKSAIQLNSKLEEEKKEHREEFKHLINRVIELEDNYQKISNKLEEMEKLIVHKDNNYKVSSRAILELLMDIQDKLKDK